MIQHLSDVTAAGPQLGAFVAGTCLVVAALLLGTAARRPRPQPCRIRVRTRRSRQS